MPFLLAAGSFPARATERISARRLPHPGTAWSAAFYRGSVATGAAGLAEV